LQILFYILKFIFLNKNFKKYSGQLNGRRMGDIISNFSFSPSSGVAQEETSDNSPSTQIQQHNPLIVIQHKNSIGTTSSSSSSFQKRKSSTSITSLRFGGAGGVGGGTKSSSTSSKPSPNKSKRSDAQKIAKLVGKSAAPPMIDRIAKFRAFKQKSLAIEMMFARSSSGASSLEHQTSFDDSSLATNNRGKKNSNTSPGNSMKLLGNRMSGNVLASTMGGKRPTVAFRVPNLFSLVNNR
jgi:hypothetical protein